jgi:mono/diheme cytochrome c family protein
VLLRCACAVFIGGVSAQSFRPDIPVAWEDKEVHSFNLPLPQRDRSPHYLTSAEYYALTVRPVYRTYPVYAPGREPAGYMDALRQKEPEIVFDPSRLKTKEDWIRAGEAVFDAPHTLGLPVPPEGLSFPPGTMTPTTREGIIPSRRYVIRQKGVVLLEAIGGSCAQCHSRLLPDGAVLKGAPSDVPFEQNLVALNRQRGFGPATVARLHDIEWLLSGAPWITPRETFDRSFSVDEWIRRHSAMPAGVLERQGTSYTHPTRIPSLIGIEDIRYLDATGHGRHRSIGDLMRYAIVNSGLDITARYGDFQPAQAQSFVAELGTRFSDEQLYALALYIYSLRPPPNPHSFDDGARRGQRIFQQQGCAACHTPPLYTNNKLTPVAGFQVPEDLRATDNIMDIPVNTDAGLALETRRGTGFYKVPSLRGVWYRHAFGHAGQAESLEEWLDPARLQASYVPKGFHLGPGPIKGH